MTVEIPGVDYSSGRPGGAALKAAGKVFAARYVSTPGNPKNLTPAEAADHKAHGIWDVVVFETTAGRALDGRSAGISDAQKALSQAVACGMPSGRPIYFAVDQDVSGASVAPYFQGVVSVLGLRRTGGYGGYKVIKYLLDNHLITFAWQTAAWSAGKRDARAHIYQPATTQTINGVSCDKDTAYFEDYGQWQPGVIPTQQEVTKVDWSDKFKLPATEFNPKPQEASMAEWTAYGNQKAGAALAEVKTLRTEVAALKTELDGVKTVLAGIATALSKVQAGGVDYAALAKAVNDDQARRLQA